MRCEAVERGVFERTASRSRFSEVPIYQNLPKKQDHHCLTPRQRNISWAYNYHSFSFNLKAAKSFNLDIFSQLGDCFIDYVAYRFLRIFHVLLTQK